MSERIAARRAEPDGLEEQLVKQLSEGRDELAVAERVWQRMSGQLADERAEAGEPVVQVAGREDRDHFPGRAATRPAPGRHGRRQRYLGHHRPQLTGRADRAAGHEGPATGPRPGRPGLPRPGRRGGRPGGRHRLQGHPRPQTHPAEKEANRILATGRAPVRHLKAEEMSDRRPPPLPVSARELSEEMRPRPAMGWRPRGREARPPRRLSPEVRAPACSAGKGEVIPSPSGTRRPCVPWRRSPRRRAAACGRLGRPG